MTPISKFEKRNLEQFVNAGLKAAHADRIKELQKGGAKLPKKDRKFKYVSFEDFGPKFAKGDAILK